MSKNPIYDYLVSQSGKVGLALVTQACKEFLKSGSRAGVVPTKRKRIPRSWVLEALDRQSGACSIGGEPLHINDAVGDHKLALVQGGKHSKWNIAASCRSHNSSKGGKSPFEESKRSGRTVAEVMR